MSKDKYTNEVFPFVQSIDEISKHNPKRCYRYEGKTKFFNRFWFISKHS